MPSIKSIGTSLPKYKCSPEEVTEAGEAWLHERADLRGLFKRFLSSTHAKARHFVIPVQEVIKLNGAAQRARIYEENAPLLAKEAALAALANGKVVATDIDSFIFASCSCPSLPSVDAVVVHSTGMRNDVTRVPMYQQGCAGGVVGLSLANKFAQTGSTVLLSSVELCSLVFQANDFTPGHLVGSAIFGDAASSAVISPEDYGLVYVDTLSYLIPHTRHLMGYEIMDDGSHLRLDKELPASLAAQVPDIAKQFLAKHNLVNEDIAWWLFHPGGVKILNVLQESFSVPDERMKWSRDILSKYGNLSSSSVLFVLSDFLADKAVKDKDYVLMLGIGPGLTLEMILFRYQA